MPKEFELIGDEPWLHNRFETYLDQGYSIPQAIARIAYCFPELSKRVRPEFWNFLMGVV